MRSSGGAAGGVAPHPATQQAVYVPVEEEIPDTGMPEVSGTTVLVGVLVVFLVLRVLGIFKHLRAFLNGVVPAGLQSIVFPLLGIPVGDDPSTPTTTASGEGGAKGGGAKGAKKGKKEKGKKASGGKEVVPLADDESIIGDSEDDEEKAEQALLTDKAAAKKAKKGKVSKPLPSDEHPSPEYSDEGSCDGHSNGKASAKGMKPTSSTGRFEFNPIDEEAEEARKQAIKRREGEM